MSADNWQICPRCKKQNEKDAADRLASAEASYGKVPASEYEKLIAAARKPVGLTATFREDYELGVDEEGTFSVTYSGWCGSCRLAFKFEHSQKVPLT